MPRYTIHRGANVVRTPRVLQVEGLFDVPPAERADRTWEFDFELPPDGEWNIGLIVGPSGCGKTTAARELFGDSIVSQWPWPSDRSLLDGFPAEMGIKEITRLLSSVGFSSPPGWLKPFSVLSNGEQFRVHLARTLAETKGIAVVDEFTSVVDRTVAQIGSAAVARTVRQTGRKFVAVSCHFDIIDWLDPDWVFQPATGDFQRRSLRRRPPITLTIRRVHRSAWKLFRSHHYLSTQLSPTAACFVGFVGKEPAAFTAVVYFPHAKTPGWREHRTVCLPDFQGVGIGHAMSEFVASLYVATGRPYRSTTTHPAMIAHRTRSPLWRVIRRPKLALDGGYDKVKPNVARPRTAPRITASFEYVGEANVDAARGFGLPVTPTR